MKINRISNNIKNHTITSVKKNNNTINSDRPEFSYSKIPANPEYYQATRNINFLSNGGFLAIPSGTKKEVRKITIHIPTQDDDKITLELDEKEAALFLNKDGQIDNKITSAFVEIYTEYYGRTKEKYKKERDFLLKILNDNSPNKLIAINPFQEMKQAFEETFEGDSESYIENFLPSIRDKDERKTLAAQYLRMIEENFAKSSHTCAVEAMHIIALSKTEDGLDLSNYATKNEIAVIIADFSKRVGYNCFDCIVENSKDSQGTFDIDTCLKISKIVLHLFPECDPRELIEKVGNTIKEIKEKDPKNYEHAIEVLTKIIENDGIDFSKDPNDIECFMECFNPINGNYDFESEKILLELFDIVGDWFESLTQNNSGRSEDNFKKTVTKAIKSYFAFARDQQTGEIKKDFISPSEFLENYTIL